MDLLEEFQALEPDQLPFAVEVRRDDDAVKPLDDRLERAHDAALGDPFQGRRFQESGETGECPLPELLRVVEFDDVPAQPGDGIRPVGTVELEDVRPCDPSRFIRPSESTTAIRRAVLNFSATTRVFGWATTSRGRVA